MVIFLIMLVNLQSDTINVPYFKKVEIFFRWKVK